MTPYDLPQGDGNPSCFLEARQTAIERPGSSDITGGETAGGMRCCGARVHVCKPISKCIGSVAGNDFFGGRSAERGSRRTVLDQPTYLGCERCRAVGSYQLIIQGEVVGEVSGKGSR